MRSRISVLIPSAANISAATIISVNICASTKIISHRRTQRRNDPRAYPPYPRKIFTEGSRFGNFSSLPPLFMHLVRIGLKKERQKKSRYIFSCLNTVRYIYLGPARHDHFSHVYTHISPLAIVILHPFFVFSTYVYLFPPNPASHGD